jgi:hypothetical protein
MAIGAHLLAKNGFLFIFAGKDCTKIFLMHMACQSNLLNFRDSAVALKNCILPHSMLALMSYYYCSMRKSMFYGDWESYSNECYQSA